MDKSLTFLLKVQLLLMSNSCFPTSRLISCCYGNPKPSTFFISVQSSFIHIAIIQNSIWIKMLVL